MQQSKIRVYGSVVIESHRKPFHIRGFYFHDRNNNIGHHARQSTIHPLLSTLPVRLRDGNSSKNQCHL
jgi:hypothetical protein